MKYDLLRMTQLILSSMDSDEVNSISDTVESQQVVDIIETTYNDLISTLDLPELWDFFELEASGDITKPTILTVPSAVSKVEWIKYDVSDGPNKQLLDIKPIERGEFMARAASLDEDESDVFSYTHTVGTGTFQIRGKNDRNPSCYMTPDNKTIFFNDYLASESSTIVGNRTQCYGMITPAFLRQDSWTPDLSSRQFTLLFNEAKAQCFVDLKQASNNKAEQRARRGWVHSQRKKEAVDGAAIRNYYPDYGRR